MKINRTKPISVLCPGYLTHDSPGEGFRPVHEHASSLLEKRQNGKAGDGMSYNNCMELRLSTIRTRRTPKKKRRLRMKKDPDFNPVIKILPYQNKRKKGKDPTVVILLSSTAGFYPLSPFDARVKI